MKAIGLNRTSDLRWRSCAVLFVCLSVVGPSKASRQAPTRLPSQSLPTQSPPSLTLNGIVWDPSGANVPFASVHVESSSNATGPTVLRDIFANATGEFSLTLPAGVYNLTVIAPGFKPFLTAVDLDASSARERIHASLTVAAIPEEITVPLDANSTSAADNAGALVFRGDTLKTFSDDDPTFQKEILALAGSDGLSTPQFYVDGFSGSHFPPKATIREIRINQNPYSAQFDALGFGRVEVFTKPGADKFHGALNLGSNGSFLNSRNPFTGAQPPYYVFTTDGNINGPIDRKTSFFLSGYYYDQQGNSVVNAEVLDTNLLPITLSQAIPVPQTNTNVTARVERQLDPSDTFLSRYEFNRLSLTNLGVGQLVLPSEGAANTLTSQTLQLGNTRLLGPSMVSETRFQYIRTRQQQAPVSTTPTLIVEGAFSAGGSAAQHLSDNLDQYEFQEHLSLSKGAHFLRGGFRYRLLRDANLSTANYNGQFIFPSLTAYRITLQGLSAGLTQSQIRISCILSGGASVCGGASQFHMTSGQPSAVVLSGDLGLYAEDEWKLRKNFTLDLGIRFETQTAIPGRLNPAPRVGFAWAVGLRDKHPAVLTLRGGAGIFYDRFASTNILTAIRQQTGTTQPSIYLANPDCGIAYPFLDSIPVCALPSTALLSSAAPSLYSIDPSLHTAYTITEGLTAERRFGKKATLSVTYTHFHGVHQYDSLNLNSPLPGTYNPSLPSSGARPLGGSQNIYQFSANGQSSAQRLSASFNLNPTKGIQLWSYYFNRFQTSNTSGATSFPSNSFNPSADLGRVATPAQRIFIGSFIQLPFGFIADSFFAAQSGSPYNITTGTDLNGDSQFNDRPSFATDLTRSSVVRTALGNFDTLPLPSQTIVPINYATAPAYYNVDIGLQRDFKFGPRPAVAAVAPGSPSHRTPPARPDPRYTLEFGIDAENLLNHVNPGTPVGVLTSPLFGHPLSLNNAFQGTTSANRTILLRTSLTF